MTMNGFDLDEIERLLAAATPGEWEFVAEEVKDANATWLWIAPKTWHTRVARVVVYKTQEDEQEANAALIVAARNSLPTILTEIRELRAENARLREALVRLRDCDWVISLPDRMDAVRDIARAALGARGGKIVWGDDQ